MKQEFMFLVGVIIGYLIRYIQVKVKGIKNETN